MKLFCVNSQYTQCNI